MEMLSPNFVWGYQSVPTFGIPGWGKAKDAVMIYFYATAIGAR